VIEKTMETVMHIAGTLPPWLAAFLVGWSVSVGATQSFKFWMPATWNEDNREMTTRLVAFCFSAGGCGLYYARTVGADPAVLGGLMIACGVWAPLAFALAQAGLRRWNRTAWVADVLSGDKRGVIAAKVREHRPIKPSIGD
jgi:hypothetical protein